MRTGQQTLAVGVAVGRYAGSAEGTVDAGRAAYRAVEALSQERASVGAGGTVEVAGEVAQSCSGCFIAGRAV